MCCPKVDVNDLLVFLNTDLCSEASNPRRIQHGKNWTFPNAKASAGMDPFLCSPDRLEELHGSAMVGVRDEFEGRREASGRQMPHCQRPREISSSLCEAKSCCSSFWCYPQGCMEMVTRTDRFVVILSTLQKALLSWVVLVVLRHLCKIMQWVMLWETFTNSISFLFVPKLWLHFQLLVQKKEQVHNKMRFFNMQTGYKIHKWMLSMLPTMGYI